MSAQNRKSIFITKITNSDKHQLWYILVAANHLKLACFARINSIISRKSGQSHLDKFAMLVIEFLQGFLGS